MPLILSTVILTVGLTACSKQNWYQGGQSSLQAQCMKVPVSEYNDCMKQSSESYIEYEKSREELIKATETGK